MRPIFSRILRTGSLVFCLLALFSLTLTQSPTVSAQTGPSLASLAQQGEQACLQPPRQIHVSLLTDQQLVSYGLPSHAIIAKNPQQWAKNFAHLKHRTCSSSAKTTAHRTLKFSNCALGTSCTSNTWSGNEAGDVPGTFRTAEVSFVVPTIQTSDKNSAVSLWAGIGGDTTFSGNSVLVQAGVISSVDSAGHQTNESFWEVEPYQGVAQDLPLQSLTAGDQVYVEADSNAAFSGYNYVYIENDTVGDYNSHVDTATPFSHSSTAECIVERPTVSGTPTDLANFQTISFTGCDFTRALADGTSDIAGVGTIPHSYYTMYNTSVTPNKRLDSVGPIDSTGENYSLTWSAYS
ncbi:MAG TPA: G1 family glutamic endopeptidase [Ktedonobacteraceae bacterium]